MTLRDRYRQWAVRTPGATPLNMDNGPLMAAYERWLSEGLNPELDPRRYDEWCDAFGIDRYYLCVSVGSLPGRPALFQEEILEETETTITKRQWDGSIIQDNTGLFIVIA